MLDYINMTSVTVSVVIAPCCERMEFLTKIREQAVNLNLNEAYINAIEDLLLVLVPLVRASNSSEVQNQYDLSIDNILTLRDEAFTEWMEQVKDTHIAVPKSVVPV